MLPPLPEKEERDICHCPESPGTYLGDSLSRRGQNRTAPGRTCVHAHVVCTLTCVHRQVLGPPTGLTRGSAWGCEVLSEKTYVLPSWELEFNDVDRPTKKELQGNVINAKEGITRGKEARHAFWKR